MISTEDTFSIREAFWLIAEHKWSIIKTLVIVIGLGISYQLWIPKVYEIKARIMVYPRQNNQYNAPDWIFELSGLESVNNISNELEILRSIQILSKVGDHLEQYQELSPHVILSNLMVSNIKNTEIIEISYRTGNTEMGKALLQNLLLIYETKNQEEAKQSELKSLKFLEDRIQLVLSQLSEIELNLEKLKIKAPESLLIGDFTNFHRSKIDEHLNSLAHLNLQLQELDHLLYSDSFEVYPFYLIERFPQIKTLIDPLFEINKSPEGDYGITENHPYSKSKSIHYRQNTDRVRAGLIPLESKLKSEKKAIQKKMGSLDSTLKSIPRSERIAITLLRNQKMVESIYLLLLEKKEETSLALAAQTSNIKIIDPPFVNRKIRPNPYQTSALTIIIGLFFPIMYFIGKKSIDRRLFYYKDFSHKTSMPFLSEIPQGKMNKPLPKFYEKINSSVLERVRLMKAHLAFIQSNQTTPVFLISSYWSGEGKTFLCAHLGYAYANAGIKTVIVGVDLRKPTLQNYFEKNDIQPGLSNYLINAVSIDQIIQPSSINKYLDCIQSGPIPPNPTELIDNGRLEKLVPILKQRYDCIILDSPPIGLVADALQLSPLVTNTIFVLKFKRTRVEHLEFLNELATNNKVPAASIVLNGIPFKKSSNYYYYQ